MPGSFFVEDSFTLGGKRLRPMLAGGFLGIS